MKQFGVYGLRKAPNSYFVVLQADGPANLEVVVIAPLEPESPADLTKVHVPVVLNGAAYVALVNELAAVPRRRLGPIVANLEAHESAFKRAIDFLFFGI